MSGLRKAEERAFLGPSTYTSPHVTYLTRAVTLRVLPSTRRWGPPCLTRSTFYKVYRSLYQCYILLPVKRCPEIRIDDSEVRTAISSSSLRELQAMPPTSTKISSPDSPEYPQTC